MKKILIPLFLLLSVISAYAHCGGCAESHKKHSHAEVLISCCSSSGTCCIKKNSDEKIESISNEDNPVQFKVPIPKMACCPAEG